MVKVKLFTKSYCGFCHRALDLLKNENIEFENIEVDNGNDEWKIQKEKTNHLTVPMIFINGIFIGGSSELSLLHNSGKLKTLLEN